MERCIDRFHIHEIFMRNKVHAPDIFAVIVALIKQCIGILVNIPFQLMIILHFYPSELIINKLEIFQLAQFKIKTDKRCNLLHPLFNFQRLFPQLVLLVLHVLNLFINLIHNHLCLGGTHFDCL